MRKLLVCCALGAFLVSCRLPPDREPFKPLPENGMAFSYGELLARLHSQANAALDAFFVDAWVELDEAAKGIEQTSRFLAKAESPPEHLKSSLVANCSILQKEAIRLGAAARTKNVEGATDSLQKLTLQIRQLKATE
jgi:hypothetical protein